MEASSWGMVALLLLLLVLLLLTPRRSVAGKRVAWFRALVPSWRFFEAPDVSYVLLARAISAEGEETFQRVIPAPTRRLWNAVLAPSGNLTLAVHGLVEWLMSELAELGPTAIESAEQLPSYQLVQHAVCFFLADARPEHQHYQLRVVMERQDGSLGEELFTSPIYERA